MKDEKAPMTQGQFQTLRDMMQRQLTKMDDFEDDLNQIKRDVRQLKKNVNTIAKNTEHARDADGQLRKAS